MEGFVIAVIWVDGLPDVNNLVKAMPIMMPRTMYMVGLMSMSKSFNCYEMMRIKKGGKATNYADASPPTFSAMSLLAAYCVDNK